VDSPEELPTVLSLCTGYGGIERGLELAGFEHRVLAHVEIEAFAITNLAAKMEAGQLDAAPIWSNLKTLPVDCFRDRVDLLTGGYPCQPFSAAGKRQGKDDPRHLWPYIYDIIRAIRPVQCFFENVEGHISLGLREVIEDLEGLGYKTTFGIFSASEVGAPHQRKRIFILGNAKHHGLASSEIRRGIEETSDNNEGWKSEASKSQGTSEREVNGDLCGEKISPSISNAHGHALRKQSGGSGREERTSETLSGVNGEARSMANPDSNDRGDRRSTLARDRRTRLEHRSGSERQLVGQPKKELANTSGSRSKTGLPRSERPEQERHTEITHNGSDRSGWRQSENQWAVEPNVGRVVNGCPDRVDRLRLLGNGVVPQTAAKAWIVLNEQIKEDK